METIIVTGGLGFIGSNLINILKNKYFIINIDKVSYASNFKNIDPSIKNYKFYKIDINNKIFIKNILRKYNTSIIFRFYCMYYFPFFFRSPRFNMLWYVF